MKTTVSISFKLVGFMLAVSVLPLLMLQVASYLAGRQTMIDRAMSQHAQLLEIQRDYLNLQTEQIESLAETPAWIKEVERLPVASNTDSGVNASYAALLAKTRIGQLLGSYTGLGALESLDLFAANGGQYHIGERLNGSDRDASELARQMARASESPRQTVWIGVNRAGASGSQPVLSAIKAMYKSDPSGSKPEVLGMLRANFSTDYLHAHFRTVNLGEGGYLLLLDQRGAMVYHPNKALIGQPVPGNLAQTLVRPTGSDFVEYGGESVLLTHLRLPDKGWTLLAVVPQSTVTAPLRRVQQASVALLVGCLLVIAWFTRMYLHRVVYPLRDVSNGFRDFQANRLAPDWRLAAPKAWIQMGALVHWFNAFLDTTQRQREVADALQASEERNRGLIRAIPDQIFVNQRDGRFLDVQAGNEALLLHPADFLMNRTVVELLPPEVATLFIHAIGRALDSGQMQEFQYALEIRGQDLDFEARLVATGDDTVISLVRDITGRKRTEMALQESEERYRTAFKTSRESINISRLKDGCYLDVNDEFTRLTGWTKEEAIGKTSGELNLWRNIDDRQRMVDILRCDGFCENLQIELVTRNGRIFTGLLSANVMTLKGEMCLFSVTRDITELKHAEEELRIAATAFESEQGMIVTNAQRVILRVNRAFTAITGYGADEAVGQTPSILSSGRHDSAYYAAMTQALESTGAWQGEIWNRRKNGEVYPEWISISAVKGDAGMVTHYVSAFVDISERVKAQAQVDTLAFYDPLTSLPNRRLLRDRLNQALQVSTRHARNNALLFVDLDNFKTLNDTLGHSEGDALLVQVAQRLKACVRDGDTVARLGSDEFLVLLEDLSEDDIEAATQAETVGEKIFEAFRPHFSLGDGVRHHCTTSIGITLFGGLVEGSEQPLKRAELAMFQAKTAGRNSLRFFDAQMQEKVSALAALEVDLRTAVAEQQFSLHYQPQVVGVGRITGAEALIRWQHPLRGMVSPAEFIPLAEHCALILELGQWVLETACAQLAVWATDPALAHLTVAVNVSASQFKHPGFVNAVLDTLARTRATPTQLKLELTESMLVDDVETIILKMGVLRAHGICFSLDDFGTGYSSLAYLKRLPLDQLKIDQGFVQNIVTDPNDAAIAKMVVVLAQSMGLSVIAEGVELQAQADLLMQMGCHAYQGYLFSRPLPLLAFEKLARQKDRLAV